MEPEVRYTVSDIKAAIDVESLVRGKGAMLFIDTDDVLKVLWDDRINSQLTQLCRELYGPLKWLLKARAS